jgi:peptide-methionine (S)-S-oxide reductase
MNRLLAAIFLFVSALFAAPGMAAPAARPATETAIFAGGCFWCVEHDLQAVPGVIDAVSGYTGGKLANPNYQEVVTETTGHFEAVKVTYDPARISYRQLVDRFFRLIDPTDAGGQFCDRGPSYSSAIFAAPTQTADAEAARAEVARLLRKPVATTILPAQTFWPAEDYHQDYAEKNRARYTFYRTGCGRDARVRSVWKGVS